MCLDAIETWLNIIQREANIYFLKQKSRFSHVCEELAGDARQSDPRDCLDVTDNFKDCTKTKKMENILNILSNG